MKSIVSSSTCFDTATGVAARILLGFLMAYGSAVRADEWMTWASTYTHDPETGERVDQYSQPAQPLGPDYWAAQRNVYRNYRSTLQAGLSADNYHLVERWGEPIIPYEQWRFPYRPYGVPYGAWGPPTPYGIFFGGGYGYPYPYPYSPGNAPEGSAGGSEGNAGTGSGSGASGGSTSGLSGGSAGPAGNPARWPYPWGGFSPLQPYPWFPLQPPYLNQPWYDGTYPPAPPLDRRTDAEFFYHPPIGRPPSP